MKRPPFLPRYPWLRVLGVLAALAWVSVFPQPRRHA